jgi:ABC-type lipoprotein export system ATPase subunit
MPKKTELFNWYEKIPDRYLKKTHNPHFDTHHIKLPMRSVILGNSGSGKTQTLMNIIYNMPETFEKIYIITKDKKEPIYEYVEDKYKKKGVEVLEGVENLPDLSLRR